MKGFCLLLFVFLFAVYGYCQELMHSEADALEMDMAGAIVLMENEVNSEDLLNVGVSEESQDEMEVPLSPQSPGISITPQFDYKESKYWGSYIALRTAGWITLGTGVVFFISGYSCILSAWGTSHDAVADRLAIAGSIMLVSSPILVVGSIPLLACAYYNRSKAKKMYLNAGASILPSGGASPYKTSIPAMTFSLTF